MNEEIKERIVKGALELFLSHGIKIVTMNKIASYLVMSKRTIYEHFTDKESLVSECLLYLKNEKEGRTQLIRASSANSFAFLLEMFKAVVSELRNINVNFFVDMRMMFPELMLEAKMSRAAQTEEFRRLIEAAQNDGFIEEKFSSHVLAEFYYNTLRSMTQPGTYDYEKTSYIEVLRCLCSVYFRGIATAEGEKIMRECMKEF